MAKTTYAVVDIETTGTSHVDDRIIQIGIVLVEGGKIVQSYATDVNPGRSISKQIEHLTGISNAQVAYAPYFEDVAMTLYNLLQDTVFVAHNIYFDFNFLNAEFRRVGMPILENQGIDTVELSQVFLPTESSFRLGDLANRLQFQHDRPHQADSDALVTAELLLHIEEEIRKLPLPTLETIMELSGVLGVDNDLFIKNRYLERKNKMAEYLHASQHLTDGIVLKNKSIPTFSGNYFVEQKYPRSKKAKEKLFGTKVDVREEQVKFMNGVYDHFSREEVPAKDLFIEAATGTGKTFGYLFPLSYLATPEQPLIVSTVSIVLQNQLLEKDLTQVNQVTPYPYQATLVKSSQHYIDLQRFKQTLNQPVPQKQYALYQMAVLVWLTQTETGDLEELNQTNYNHLFFQQVAHRGVNYLDKQNPLYQDDFLLYLRSKMKSSNLLIVNHAFLAQESLREEFYLPQSPYLIIDEAHHLPSTLQHITTSRVNGAKLARTLSQAIDEEGKLFEINHAVEKKISISEQHMMKLLANILEELNFEVSTFFSSFGRALQKKKHPMENQEVLIEDDFLALLDDNGQLAMKKMNTLFADCDKLAKNIHQALLEHLERFSVEEKMLITDLFDLFSEIEQAEQIFHLFVENWDKRYVKWATQKKNQQFLTLHVGDFEANQLFESKWHERYVRILYTSGTLKFGKDKNYIPNQLGLTKFTFKTVRSPFDYSKQAKLFVPNDAPQVSENHTAHFAKYLADAVEQIADQQNKPILVLFTSHDLLQKTYYDIHMRLLNKGREVLGQNISGSREKILKRFTHSENALLFGADSFWEGVDLPGDSLQILVITRLPFENPKRPFVESYYEYLISHGVSAFSKAALPKAGLRLRQGLGRLVRTKEDKGILFILDERIMKKSYGKRLLASLPEDLSVEYAPFSELLQHMQDFF
ncbi:MAG: DEAD/DEAH box helicase family protein [Lactobacillales bacterium]|jgi:ATP-dependent DNA helicase DinG|nr:DEAD/DEAH box helicase family protein [Lactobacillales bacterium]